MNITEAFSTGRKVWREKWTLNTFSPASSILISTEDVLATDWQVEPDHFDLLIETERDMWRKRPDLRRGIEERAVLAAAQQKREAEKNDSLAGAIAERLVSHPVIKDALSRIPGNETSDSSAAPADEPTGQEYDFSKLHPILDIKDRQPHPAYSDVPLHFIFLHPDFDLLIALAQTAVEACGHRLVWNDGKAFALPLPCQSSPEIEEIYADAIKGAAIADSDRDFITDFIVAKIGYQHLFPAVDLSKTKELVSFLLDFLAYWHKNQ